MYAGRKVEEAPVAEIFRAPAHPYTRGLLASGAETRILADRPATADSAEIQGRTEPHAPRGLCLRGPRCPIRGRTSAGRCAGD